MLKVINTGKARAQKNMELDRQLLLELPQEPSAVLHFYEWERPSATFGHFSNPNQWINPKGIEAWGLDLAKRPTGGGIIFHSFDYAFSFLLSASHPLFSLNTLDNYALVNQVIIRVIEKYIKATFQMGLSPCENCEKASSLKAFCMATPTVYDVISQGRKIAGGAQRRTKQGFLHQASIALTCPSDSFLESLLGLNSPIAKAMKENTFPLLAKQNESSIAEAKNLLKNCLAQEFQQLLFQTKIED